MNLHSILSLLIDKGNPYSFPYKIHKNIKCVSLSGFSVKTVLESAEAAP